MASSGASRADFVVVGAGVVGLTIALELRGRHPQARIVVLEKESKAGQHASGRNSGVLHAGFYYTPDSLKAKLTRQGNLRMSEWCEEHGVAVRRCGKLVVARDDGEHDGLDELLRRAHDSHVVLESVSEAEAKRIEPRVRTAGRALWSPTTAAVDPGAVMAALAETCSDQRIELRTGTELLDHRGTALTTSSGPIAAGFVVNAAGLHAVRIARRFGFARRYAMLPFKGLYLYGNRRAPPLGVHVYPVPELDMPFLGVHFTVTVDAGVKIGPTALPAAWLESYAPLLSAHAFERFRLREMVDVARRSAQLFLHDAGLRRHARRELPKRFRHELVRRASVLVDGVEPAQFERWGRPGIRAQLMDIEQHRLVMDFVFERDQHSLHVLNAVSPAFTCAFPFAEMVVDAIEQSGSS